MPCLASDIAKFVKTELIGEDILILYPKSLLNSCQNSITFVNIFDHNTVEVLNNKSKVLVICIPEYQGKINNVSYIISSNPRLDFARVTDHFFNQRKENQIASMVIYGNDVKLGRYISIGEYSVIGNNVTIGDCTIIRNHVIINDNVIIGKNCYIKSNTVIGEKGFGFEHDEKGIPICLPHFGRVIIGDNVEIGALNTIAQGTLDDTIIGNNVKTDDHVHIAHNVHIGDNTIITACSEISGSVNIGKNVWLGPNCSIMNKINIGDNVLVGLGTVVLKSVEPNLVIAGNPAKNIREKGNR